ncbi:MAG: hypothetical protein R2838_10320 [Caldilineaceae bacterium]
MSDAGAVKLTALEVSTGSLLLGNDIERDDERLRSTAGSEPLQCDDFNGAGSL